MESVYPERSVEPQCKLHTEKIALDRQILKLILLITACKPASLQEHKTYSHALWDESEKFLPTCNTLTLSGSSSKNHHRAGDAATRINCDVPARP
jgi:hypothetical protein